MDTTKIDKIIAKAVGKLEYNEPTISMDYLEECLGFQIYTPKNANQFKHLVETLQKLMIRGYRLEADYNHIMDLIKSKNTGLYLSLMGQSLESCYPLLKLHSLAPKDLDGDAFLALFTYVYQNRKGKVGLHNIIDKGRATSISAKDKQINRLARSLKI